MDDCLVKEIVIPALREHASSLSESLIQVAKMTDRILQVFILATKRSCSRLRRGESNSDKKQVSCQVYIAGPPTHH